MDGPGRKRINDRELTKDNAHEEGDEGGDTGGGTFQRADENVLAGRRIVKARRPPTSGPRPAAAAPSAPGPDSKPASGLFSGFSLINQAPKSPAPAAVGDSEAGVGGEIPREEQDLDPRGRPVPPPPDPEIELGPPQAAEAGVTSDPETSDDEITSQPKKSVPQASGEARSEKGSEGKEEKSEGKQGGEEEKGGEPKAEKPASGFTFGGSDGFAKLSSATNAFASGFGGGATSTSAFSFGLSASSAAASTPSTSPATIAAPGQSAFPSLSSVFGSTNGAKVQLFGSGSEEGAAAAGNAGTGSTPVVSLPAVDVVTGEEEEKALFAAEASLFEFVEGGKWKERGKGEVRLNASDKETRPARLVMRAKGNLRLLLNANLFPEMKVTKMDGRGMSFACVNSVEDAGEGASKTAVSTWALRLKDPALAAELFELIETHKMQKPAGAAEKKEAAGKGDDVEAGKVGTENESEKAKVAGEVGTGETGAETH